MLRNIIGQIFDSNKCFSFLKSHSPCTKKNRLEKQKRKKKGKFGQMTQKRAIFGQIFDSTTYIYAVKLVTGPRLGHFNG